MDINSSDTFSYSTASARIKIRGDYQKFGFNVNDGNGLPAFYFDSYEPGADSPGGVDTIHVIVFGETFDNQDRLYREKFDVTWDQYYQFDIVWGADLIQFLIDGDLKASFPIGLWNDRSSSMLIDKVSVSVPDASIILLLSTSLIGLVGFERNFKKKLHNF